MRYRSPGPPCPETLETRFAAGTGRLIAIVSAVLIIAFFALFDPIAQDPAYHLFADDRPLLGVSNFWNVTSNLPFLFVGIYGLVLIGRDPGVVGDASLRWPWITLFAGLILTAVGSAYYHVAPANPTLVWDRLPMTLGFAGFFTILIGEYVSLRAARLLFLPLLLAGIASVVYWIMGESSGAGDLRPYAVIAIFPMIVTPAILLAYRNNSDLTYAIWAMIAFYVVAKIFEHFDALTFELLGTISGHTLKHVFAALSAVPLIRALQRRRAPREAISHG